MNTKTTIIILIFIILGTRIPFATKHIFTHDSVNFALALEEFNIEKHQPHPPGYIIYIGIAKFLNLFIKDVNTAFVIISIIFSCLAIIYLFLLGKEAISYRCGLLSSIFFIFSPIFWAYGELALSYVADAFAATSITYFIYKVITGHKKYIFFATICLGLVSGIRLTLLLYLLPLWIIGLIYVKSYKKIIHQCIILVASILIWLIPLAIITGGISNYINSIIKITYACVLPAIKPIKRITYTFASSVYGLGLTIIPLIISIKNIKILPGEKRRNLFIILVAWLTLIFLLCFSIYPGNPGHALIFLPAFFMLSSIFVYKECKRPHLIITALTIIINSFVFLLMKPLEPGDRIWFFRTDKIKNFANFWGLDYSYKGLRREKSRIKFFTTIKENFNPESTAIVVASSRSLEPYIPARVTYYYLRGYPIFEIKNEPQSIKLPENINTIVWFLHPHNAKTIPQTTVINEVYFSKINKDTIKFANTKFYK